MKTMFVHLMAFFLLVGLLTVSHECQAQRRRNPVTFYDYEVECMGVGSDGTQFLKVWSYGRRVNRAISQAKRNAVHAVIFRGITSGKPGCMQRPLVTRPDTGQQHREFFEAFFREGGRYLNFVAITSDGHIADEDRLRVGRRFKVGVEVTVMHSALRKELEAANVIPRLGTGF